MSTLAGLPISINSYILVDDTSVVSRSSLALLTFPATGISIHQRLQSRDLFPIKLSNHLADPKRLSSCNVPLKFVLPRLFLQFPDNFIIPHRSLKA